MKAKRFIPEMSWASYTRWKPGLLVIGLWITLKISVLSTIFGVIIGIIGGLMRISSNPALQVDLHRLCGTDPRVAADGPDPDLVFRYRNRDQ